MGRGVWYTTGRGKERQERTTTHTTPFALLVIWVHSTICSAIKNHATKLTATPFKERQPHTFKRCTTGYPSTHAFLSYLKMRPPLLLLLLMHDEHLGRVPSRDGARHLLEGAKGDHSMFVRLVRLHELPVRSVQPPQLVQHSPLLHLVQLHFPQHVARQRLAFRRAVDIALEWGLGK